MRAKQYLFDLLDGDEINTSLERVLNLILMLLIILNVVAVIVDASIESVTLKAWLGYFEVFSVIIFSVEYLARIYVADLKHPGRKSLVSRIMYIASPMAIIDLLAILPFYLPFMFALDLRALRSLRLLRLLRLFKANRYIRGLNTVILVLKNKATQLISSISVVLVLMITSATVMYSFEHDAQPEVFKNVFDSFWWSVATLTTVGYGDIYPVTAVGRIFASIIALLGIGIVAIPTGIIASGFTEVSKSRTTASKCPHCGKEIA